MNKNLLLIAISIVMLFMPFYPEPHLIKQWNKIADGSFGEIMDYLDILMHVGPMVYLVYVLASDKLKKTNH